jgi:hypothetical protein
MIKKMFKANWSGIILELSEDEYEIAMSHVEHMRQVSEENNANERLDETDEDYLDPEGWKLSDTLDWALKEAKSDATGNGLPEAELVRKGLAKLAEELSILDPCGDDGADDVFQTG